MSLPAWVTVDAQIRRKPAGRACRVAQLEPYGTGDRMDPRKAMAQVRDGSRVFWVSARTLANDWEPCGRTSSFLVSKIRHGPIDGEVTLEPAFYVKASSRKAVLEQLPGQGYKGIRGWLLANEVWSVDEIDMIPQILQLSEVREVATGLILSLGRIPR